MKPENMMEKTVEKLLSGIYPERCLLCRDLPFIGDEEFRKYGLCQNCRKEVYLASFSRFSSDADHRSLLEGHASYLYEDKLRDALERLKYGKRKKYGLYFGRWMYEEAMAVPELKSWLGRTDYLVPVPLAPLRLRERGYNQAALMAGALSEETGIPVMEMLERCRETRYQKSLGIAMREKNVAGAFRVKEDLMIPSPERIVLVDDIYTTGATLEDCIRALQEKWPEAEVLWWTFAIDK